MNQRPASTVIFADKFKYMTYRYSDNSLPMVLIIGAGFAGLELIKQFNNKPFRVLLLDKNNYHTFQPLLYQIASAGLTAESIAYPVRRKIGAYPNIAFRVAEVSSVDTSGQLVHTDIGEFHYDYLIIASGASTNFYGNNSLASTTFPLKSVQDALNMRTTILQQFEKAVNASKTNGSKLLNFIIVGGGPTGVELAGALAEIKKNVVPSDYRELDPEMMEVHLIEAAPRVLGTMSEKSSRLAKKYLEQLGVKVWLNAVVNSYENDILTLSNDTKITAHHVIWTAGVKGVDIKGLEGNIRTRGNRIITDRYHRVSGFEKVYAIGDIACILGDERYPQGHPGVAQVAIQQAHNLASNFMRNTNGKSLQAFNYRDKGSMATIGRHKAVVDLPFISFGGYLAWYIWMFIHLMALVGFRNRFMVFMNWMWNYITYDRALRLILKK